MRRGRPLRFMALSLAGWTGARAVLLWPVADTLATVAELVGIPEAVAVMLAVAPPPAPMPAIRHRKQPAPATPSARYEAVFATFPKSAEPVAEAPADPPQLSPTLFMPAAPDGPSRFAASVWILARGGQTAGLLGGQLGASQAGARLTYALGDSRKLAISARVAAPLRGGGSEAALGLDWEPFAAPFHIIAEQRFSLDGSRGGPALFAVGGIGPEKIGPGLRVEAYAQAGVVLRGATQPFGDGAMRLTQRVLAAEGTRIDIGVGAWGGAQPGAARVDAGPSFSVATRAGEASVRVTLDWRERIAGDAAPGSGPALSIGSDF